MDEKTLFTIIKEITEYEGEIKKNLSLEYDLGMESLMYIDFASIMLRKYHIRIDMERLINVQNVEQLCELVSLSAKGNA